MRYYPVIVLAKTHGRCGRLGFLPLSLGLSDISLRKSYPPIAIEMPKVPYEIALDSSLGPHRNYIFAILMETRYIANG